MDREHPLIRPMGRGSAGLPGRRGRAWRILRAGWRDTVVLLGQFWVPLLTLGGLVAVVSVIFHLLYRHPDFPNGISLLEAVYAVIALTFLQSAIPFPGKEQWYLEWLYLLMPVAGVVLAGQGVMNFLSLLFNRRARAEEWHVAVVSTLSSHVVVAGLGHVGFRVVKELLSLGEQVVAIERSAESTMRERVVSWDVPVLGGDARQAEVLERAGITRAAAIVICTNNDLANIEIGLRARELNPRIRVVLRMFDEEFARKLARQLGFDTALSTSALAAPVFAGAAVSTEISQSFYVDDMVLSASRVTVNPDGRLVGRTVADLERELDLTVLLHQTATLTDLHPDPTRALAGADQLIVFAGLPALTRLTQMNKDREHGPGRAP